MLGPELLLSLARHAASQLTAAERLTFAQDVAALWPRAQALAILAGMAHDPDPLVADAVNQATAAKKAPQNKSP